jgi:Effector Associated Constant Component 1
MIGSPGGDMQQLIAEVSVSDYSQLSSLADYLSLAMPELRVTRVAGHPGAGEQGTLDMLTILADSSVLIAAIRILPEFLRSRKTALSITTTVKGKPFTLTATNVDEVMSILNKLLDD